MKVVETLLFAGATVDAVNDAGLSPLMLAILSHHVEVALLLVMNAADVTVSSPEQQSCLHFASKSFPCEQENRYMLLLYHMVEFGADINARDSLGQTPLHV